MPLHEIYEKFKETGELDVRAFLELGGEHSDLSTRRGGFEFQSKSNPGLKSLLGLRLEFSRPFHHSKLALFLFDGEKVNLCEDPITVLSSLTDLRSTELEMSEISGAKALEAAGKNWALKIFREEKKRTEEAFQKDAIRLAEYYRLSGSELAQRKKSIFFHNYYFEKEARIKEEVVQLRSEMDEQRDLLKLRYMPRYDFQRIFYGERMP